MTIGTLLQPLETFSIRSRIDRSPSSRLTETDNHNNFRQRILREDQLESDKTPQTLLILILIFTASITKTLSIFFFILNIVFGSIY